MKQIVLTTRYLYSVICEQTCTCMCLGDKIDAAYQDELQEIVDLTGTPETAYNIFSDVVKHPFDLDEHGRETA